MNVKQLKTHVIEPTLEYFAGVHPRYNKIYTTQAVKLLLMTAAVETNMGKYIIQNNPKMSDENKALGIYQLEAETIGWIFSRRNSKLLQEVKRMIDMRTKYALAVSDLAYSTILARLVYWYKTPDQIPSVDDNNGLWLFYKKWYNSSHGATTKERFFKLCEKHKLI